MNPQAFQQYTDQLCSNITGDERVLGLVAAGSMANLSRQDEWSDHDFFLIVQSGYQEAFRQDLSWLPDTENIVLHFRETEHGLKVMFANAHLVEFAVFDLEELSVARVNDYAVLLDKVDLSDRMKSLEHTSSETVDVMKNLLHCLSLIQVGTGRYARGEQISGHAFVKMYALGHLLKVLAALLDAPNKSRLDNLDIYRRFEQVFPAQGAELNAILLQDVVTCAHRLLHFIEREVKPHMADFPQAAVDTLVMHLGRIKAV